MKNVEILVHLTFKLCGCTMWHEIFCGSLFLRIGDFFRFAETNFLRLGHIGFSR